ncbi:single-stranded-DNA-specific exonuclease RecJ [Aerococcaceae bacterium DSM 111020]|nr:single-stranded-DNA-specific exonuclease RecJ [Aerococcaceae bacterium DSM 111020]
MLNLAKYSWSTKQAEDEETILSSLQEAGLNHSPAFLRVCIRRGLTTVEAIQEATEPQPQLFHEPYLMHDMKRAIERIEAAVEAGEKIIIYGDYDADGITSTLILYEGLQIIGANVTYYLPNRLTDGYGPNLSRYQSLIENEKVELIITCDNGVAGHEAIHYANTQEVDVIVTDHHQIQETLPEAYAIVHPAHPEGNYPFHELSGAGVALKVIAALFEEVPAEFMELAAIGTVADMMALTDENRTIVLAGLEGIKHTQRIGLQFMLEAASVNIESVNSQTIGFVIGPRLNAVGRLGDPSPGLELLLTQDIEKAKELVSFIERQNTERKQIESEIMSEVEQQLATYETIPDIIIESSPDWAAGVLGITAGKIVRKYHRPTILFQEQDDQLKGSGRSIEGVDLFELLTENKASIKDFGGHSQAAGMTIEVDQFLTFKEQMNQSMIPLQNIIQQPQTLAVDIVLNTEQVDEDLVEEFDLLQPFGMENEEPIVKIEESVISQCRAIGSDKNHLKMTVQNKSHRGSELQTIGFHMMDQAQSLKTGQPIHLVGKLSINEWNNQRIPQLQLLDLGTDRTVWIDCRGSRIPEALWTLDEAVYIFSHNSLAQQFESRVSRNSKIYLYDQLPNQLNQSKVVLMEPAPTMPSLKRLFENFSFDEVYLGSYVHESKYMAGLPTRNDTAQCFRWLRNQDAFAIRENLARISQRLGLSTTILKLLFIMFFEAGFVTIENGVIENVEKLPETKIDLTLTKAYQNYEEAMRVEQLMNYEPIETVKHMVEGN